MTVYGHKEQEGYPLAAWLWGHRLRIGQHWMEYLLEFLNVLAGFDYNLAQGIADGEDDLDIQEEYKRFTRLGLRRFVFYDASEKTRHPFDEYATRALVDSLRADILIDGNYSDQDPIELTRTLLRAFSAIEEQRSWYAKSLFPAHHNFLFWEALRKGATKRQSQADTDDVSFPELDAGITFEDRNFFARGGEIYYLILSAGTQNNPNLRAEIATSLRNLLTQNNQALGELALIIDRAWTSLLEGDNDVWDETEGEKTGRLGWIPDPRCEFYRVVADDLSMLLKTNLDPLETLDLLAHLIGFHLTLYIYHRAHPLATPSIHTEGSCNEVCRPTLLIDCLSETHGSVIRHVSAMLFQEQEAQILKKAQQYIIEFVQDNAYDVQHLDSETHIHFNLRALRMKTREPFETEVGRLYQLGDEIDSDTFINDYSSALINLLMGDFRKNFSGVHRKLSKAVGFVAPRQGPGARFVLEDTLLKALTLANTPEVTEITYDHFLTTLYERYGLVVGPREARESGLFDKQRINTEYYNYNKAALLEKLKHAGLAIEYSDATAMITDDKSGN